MPSSHPTLLRTNSTHPGFISLVKELDKYLAVMDGDQHAFYHQYNKIDNLDYVVLAMDNNTAVSCGAIKPYAQGVMEVKRMFTLPQFRGKNYAGSVLNELESWAAELGNNKCILETGKKQEAAIRLYSRSGYNIIPNYGQYAGIDNSVCFEKNLS